MAAVITATMSSQLFGSMNVAYAKKSPYDSGYDHGCKDGKISDASDRYINQQERGPSFHTQEFMNGYTSGFNSCANTGGGSNRGGGGSYTSNTLGTTNYGKKVQGQKDLQKWIDNACAAGKRGDYEGARQFLSMIPPIPIQVVLISGSNVRDVGDFLYNLGCPLLAGKGPPNLSTSGPPNSLQATV